MMIASLERDELGVYIVAILVILKMLAGGSTINLLIGDHPHHDFPMTEKVTVPN